MAPKKHVTFEKNIYVEERCGAYRFIVKVFPLNDSSTFSSMAEGIPWARRRRVELFDEKVAMKKNGGKSTDPVSKAGQIGATILPSVDPASISMGSIFDSYEKFDLPKLSGRAAEASRISNLRTWFGGYSLGELDSKALIDEWKSKRELGLLGSGRNPHRGD